MGPSTCLLVSCKNRMRAATPSLLVARNKIGGESSSVWTVGRQQPGGTLALYFVKYKNLTSYV